MSPIPAILLSPEVIMAVATATELFVRNILRDIDGMDSAELAAFVAKQKQRKAEHDAWLDEH